MYAHVTLVADSTTIDMGLLNQEEREILVAHLREVADELDRSDRKELP